MNYDYMSTIMATNAETYLRRIYLSAGLRTPHMICISPPVAQVAAVASLVKPCQAPLSTYPLVKLKLFKLLQKQRAMLRSASCASCASQPSKKDDDISSSHHLDTWQAPGTWLWL